MTPGPFQPYAEYLAPGDRDAQGSMDASWSALTIDVVQSASDPLFDQAWTRLWREFGERGEMERREVIRDRLAWSPEQPVLAGTQEDVPARARYSLLYEVLALRLEGRIVAIRDHTVIVPLDMPPADAAAPEVVVHLSHVLVEPDMRGRGLAAWLRALPIATAKRCVSRLVAAGLVPAGSAPRITLVAEMEHDDGVTPAVRRRLRSYARAGFRVADPHRVHYSQPDFRSAGEIARTGETPVPLCLVMRRVGREHENSIPAAELGRMIDALHAMFAVHVRCEHMRLAREVARSFPDAHEAISLLVPGVPPAEDRRILK